MWKDFLPSLQPNKPRYLPWFNLAKTTAKREHLTKMQANNMIRVAKKKRRKKHAHACLRVPYQPFHINQKQ